MRISGTEPSLVILSKVEVSFDIPVLEGIERSSLLYISLFQIITKI